MKLHTTSGLAGLLLATVLLVASCGGVGEESAAQGDTPDRSEKNADAPGGPSEKSTDGGYSDERFIDKMVPHHRSAVEMAEVALDNAEHRQIKELSENIISTQEAEIKELRAIKFDEFGTSKVSSGMDMGQMPGMGTMDAGDLAGREPFDRAFIDAMIPHHASAVGMAEAAEKKSDSARIRALAKSIVGAQEREISQLRAWREAWYPEG